MFKTFFRVMIPLLVAGLIFVGVYQVRRVNHEDIGGTTYYTSDTLGVSFEYPSEWGVPSEQEGELVFLHAFGKPSLKKEQLSDEEVPLSELTNEDSFKGEKTAVKVPGASEAFWLTEDKDGGLCYTLCAKEGQSLYQLTMLDDEKGERLKDFETVAKSLAIR